MFHRSLFIVIIGVVLIFIFTLIFNSCTTWKPFKAKQTDFQNLLNTICTHYNQPAMAGALIVDGEIFAQGISGTAVYREDRPVNVSSRFHIGSTTKSMTALIIAILVDQGKLSYSMTLDNALPFIDMLPAYKNVTINQLLLSKAGIVPFQNTTSEDPDIVTLLWEKIPLAFPDPTEQRVELAKIVLNLEPINTPGTKAVYSNAGWAVAGLIAEHHSDYVYEELLEQYIFKPLGMENSIVGGWPLSIDEPDQPHGHYVESSGELRPQGIDDPYVFPAWMNPAGGVHCSINDFALYAMENLRGLRGEGKLLHQPGYEVIHSIHETVNSSQMYQHINSNQKINLAYGWGIVPKRDCTISMADGSGGTFYARIVLFPEFNGAFAGFTNSGNGNNALSSLLKQLSGFKL